MTVWTLLIIVSFLWGITGIFIVPRSVRNWWRCLVMFILCFFLWWFYWPAELLTRTGLFRSANDKGPFEKDDSMFFR